MPTFLHRHRLWLLIFTLVGVHLAWSIFFWRSSFDADEAVLALIAKHMKDGVAYAPYFWGVPYGGTLQSAVAIPFLWIFGDNVVAIRLSVLACLLAFFVMHAVWTNRIFGRSVAMISTLVMAFPGYSIYQFMVRFSCRWHMYLLLWMILLFCFTYFPVQRSRQRWLLAISGIVMGLMFWTQPLSLVYFAALGGLWLFGSSEWQRFRAWGARIFKKFFKLSGDIPFAMTGGIIVILAPVLIWSEMGSSIAKFGLLLLIVVSACSRRKITLLSNVALLALGFAIGNFPQWGSWWLLGIEPSLSYNPSFPTIQSLTDFFIYVPPSFLGIRPLTEFAQGLRPAYEIPLGIAIAIMSLTSVIVFFVRNRNILSDMLMMKPLHRDSRFTVMLMFFLIVIWLSIIGQAVTGEGHVRYLAATWQAHSIAVAMMFVWLWQKKQWLTVLLATIWIGHFFVRGTIFTYQAWSRQQFSAWEVKHIEEFLHSNDSTVGYADFWHAYVFDFLTEERLRLSSPNGVKRYEPYEREVLNAPRQAYILRSYFTIPSTDNDLQTLGRELEKRYMFPPVVERLAQQHLVERKKIGTWDVWIVSD